MTTFLFAGQGVDLPWVAAELLAEPAVAQRVSTASDATGVDVERLLTRGGPQLTRSDVMQPAMVAVCLGVHRLLENSGVQPTIVVGHSLGELTAWAAAGGISADDAVKVAATRGRLMAREAARHPGGMLRVIGDRGHCERALAAGATVGTVSLGAHNANDEWIVTGDRGALDLIARQFASTRLPVGGAWHSPAMSGAVDEFAAALDALPRQAMRARMVTNRTGEFVHDRQVASLLVGQLVYPIRWVDCLRTIVATGERRLLAIGPGKMLRGLVSRTLGDRYPVEIVDSLATIAGAARRCET